MDRWNVLYLHSHDTGRCIQPYGFSVASPNLQKLAEQGVLFRRAFCAAPTCSPSRAALLTGTCPHTNGMLGLAHRGFAMHDYRRHLAPRLRSVGYHATLVGIQHEAPDAAMIGYDEILSTPSARARHVAPAAVEFLSRRPEEPFFLSVGFFETHREWTDDSASADARYIRPPAPLPDAPETRRDFARFAHDAGVLDAGMGAVLDALDRAGLADRTLVLCTTDHGIAFPRMKCHLHDTGTGVMLLLRGPGGFSGGRSIDAMVSHLDILPTLCELLGLDASPEFQGKSLLPLVQGRADRLHEELFAEVNYHAAYEPMRAVRTGRWKYIRRYDDRSRPVLPNCDDGESKSFLLRLGMADWREEAELLYDLVRDPCEMNNLAGQPEYSPVQADMKRRLDEWMHRTDDPILRGLPVPAPRGAKVNNPDGASPCEPPVTIM